MTFFKSCLWIFYSSGGGEKKLSQKNFVWRIGLKQKWNPPDVYFHNLIWWCYVYKSVNLKTRHVLNPFYFSLNMQFKNSTPELKGKCWTLFILFLECFNISILYNRGQIYMCIVTIRKKMRVDGSCTVHTTTAHTKDLVSLSLYSPFLHYYNWRVYQYVHNKSYIKCFL